MEEVEIMIDGKKVKTISKLSKEEIDDNSMRLLLDDTVEAICEKGLETQRK